MEKLRQYLVANNESLSAFAVRIGRSASTLTRALSGQRSVSFDLALDVEIGSDGCVSADEFLTHCLAKHRFFLSPSVIPTGAESGTQVAASPCVPLPVAREVA